MEGLLLQSSEADSETETNNVQGVGSFVSITLNDDIL